MKNNAFREKSLEQHEHHSACLTSARKSGSDGVSRRVEVIRKESVEQGGQQHREVESHPDWRARLTQIVAR